MRSPQSIRPDQRDSSCRCQQTAGACGGTEWVWPAVSESQTASSKLRPENCLVGCSLAESDHRHACQLYRHRWAFLPVAAHPMLHLTPRHPAEERTRRRTRQIQNEVLADKLGIQATPSFLLTSTTPNQVC